MTLTINGVRISAGNGLITWGDLVRSLDRQLEPMGNVVTAVRLDGVEESAFREPSLCSRRLDALVTIDIETGAPDTLARRCLGDAADALVSLSSVAREAADGFRCGDVEQPRQGIEAICQGLVAVVKIVSAAGLALRHELDAADRRGSSMAKVTSDLDSVIQRLVGAQQNEDWLSVADVLEFDLLPVLADWRALLSRVCGTPLAA